MYRILTDKGVKELSVKVSLLLTKENAQLIGAPFYDELNNSFCQAVNDSSFDQELLDIEKEIQDAEKVQCEYIKIYDDLKTNDDACYFYYSSDSFHLKLDKPEGYDVWAQKMYDNFKLITEQCGKIETLRKKQEDIVYGKSLNNG